MEELFRGYVVAVWDGTDCSRKYHVLNKIVAKMCVEFYMKCWKHRNKIYPDESKQKERIIKWFENEKERAEQSEKTQVREFVKKFKINIEHCSVETIKTCIRNLKIFEQKIESKPVNDMRRYFGV